MSSDSQGPLQDIPVPSGHAAANDLGPGEVAERQQPLIPVEHQDSAPADAAHDAQVTDVPKCTTPDGCGTEAESKATSDARAPSASTTGVVPPLAATMAGSAGSLPGLATQTQQPLLPLKDISTTTLRSDPVVTMVPDDEDGKTKNQQRAKLKNYASKDSGAVLLESSPGSKGMDNLLVDSKDKYAISPCGEKQWAVVGLSEDIMVRTIKLASYEKYSSTVKDFQVLASPSFPVDEWMDLGTFTAKPGQGEQSFDLPQPFFARYLKFKFLTHYGTEFYCTASQVRVHGATMLESFQQEWQQSSAEVREMQSFMAKEKGEAGKERASPGKPPAGGTEGAEGVVQVAVSVDGGSLEGAVTAQPLEAHQTVGGPASVDGVQQADSGLPPPNPSVEVPVADLSGRGPPAAPNAPVNQPGSAQDPAPVVLADSPDGDIDSSAGHAQRHPPTELENLEPVLDVPMHIPIEDGTAQPAIAPHSEPQPTNAQASLASPAHVAQEAAPTANPAAAVPSPATPLEGGPTLVGVPSGTPVAAETDARQAASPLEGSGPSPEALEAGGWAQGGWPGEAMPEDGNATATDPGSDDAQSSARQESDANLRAEVAQQVQPLEAVAALPIEAAGVGTNDGSLPVDPPATPSGGHAPGQTSAVQQDTSNSGPAPERGSGPGAASAPGSEGTTSSGPQGEAPLPAQTQTVEDVAPSIGSPVAAVVGSDALTEQDRELLEASNAHSPTRQDDLQVVDAGASAVVPADTVVDQEALCAQVVSFTEFKEKMLHRTQLVQQGAQGPSITGQYESIFKALTNKIKTLEITQSLFNLYIDNLHLCHQRALDEAQQVRMVRQASRATQEQLDKLAAQFTGFLEAGHPTPACPAGPAEPSIQHVVQQLEERMSAVEERLLISSMAWVSSVVCLCLLATMCLGRSVRRMLRRPPKPQVSAPPCCLAVVPAPHNSTKQKSACRPWVEPKTSTR